MCCDPSRAGELAAGDRWRAGRQLLGEPAGDALAVARLCGVHAQVATSALIAGIRTDRPAPDLDGLLWTDRTLVRTWTTRGTLHRLPADELALWTGALTDRESRRRFPPSWEREHGVTAAELHTITDAVGEVLGAEPVSRGEPARSTCTHLRRPELAGPLSTGWDAAAFPDRQRSRHRRRRRPLVGEAAAPAKRWMKANADALVEVEIEGEPGYVVCAEDAEALATTPTDSTDDPLLLPGFDPWVIAPVSHRRRAVPAGRESEVSRTADWISPVLVVDGGRRGLGPRAAW